MTNSDDTELVKACRSGRRQAFDELVVRYQGPIFNLALRILGNVDDAMDATQTTFLKAYGRLETFDESRKFFSWIYGIAVREALDVRGRRARTVGSPAAADVVSTQESPEVELLRKDSEARVTRAMKDLPAEDRALVTLRHFQGLGYVEIAEVMSISTELVKSRLFSARQRLRRALAIREEKV